MGLGQACCDASVASRATVGGYADAIARFKAGKGRKIQVVP
jgi:hypothetical protein